MDLNHQGPVWSSEKKKKKEKQKEEGTRKTVQWVGEKQRRKARCGGRDRESGQTWAVLLGHSSTHGLSARLKDTLGFKRGAEEEDFFSPYCLQKHILFILAVQAALNSTARTVPDDADIRNPRLYYFFIIFCFSFISSF